LLFTYIRGSATAEVYEPKLTPLKGRAAAVELILLNERVEINLDLRSILVRVDLEIAEFAALATEGDVDIKAEWVFNAGRFVQSCERLWYCFWLPLGKGWIV
jgi:hypothetical protein